MTSLKPVPIDCITTYSKGFICSGGNGTLHLFEKTDNRNIYKKTRSVSIWIDPSISVVPQSDEEGTEPSNDILSMVLSPSEENLVCSTRMQQLYNLTLSVADLQGKVCTVYSERVCLRYINSVVWYRPVYRVLDRQTVAMIKRWPGQLTPRLKHILCRVWGY